MRNFNAICSMLINEKYIYSRLVTLFLQRETQGYRQRFRGGGGEYGTKSTAYTDSFIKMDLEKGFAFFLRYKVENVSLICFCIYQQLF